MVTEIADVSVAAERGRLAEAVSECAEALARRKADGTPLDDGRPLRLLQGLVQSFVSCVKDDAYLRTVAFLLDMWIADYYYNFAGDVPSERSEYIARIRGEFNAKDAAVALRGLAVAVGGEQADMSATMQAFVHLISEYVKAVELAERHV